MPKIIAAPEPAPEVESTRTITLRWLRQRGACESQIKIVREEWGNVPLRPEHLARAAELTLDLEWLANKLFENRPHLWRRYRKLRRPIRLQIITEIRRERKPDLGALDTASHQRMNRSLAPMIRKVLSIEQTEIDAQVTDLPPVHNP